MCKHRPTLYLSHLKAIIWINFELPSFIIYIVPFYNWKQKIICIFLRLSVIVFTFLDHRVTFFSLDYSLFWSKKDFLSASSGESRFLSYLFHPLGILFALYCVAKTISYQLQLNLRLKSDENVLLRLIFQSLLNMAPAKIQKILHPVLEKQRDRSRKR